MTISDHDGLFIRYIEFNTTNNNQKEKKKTTHITDSINN